MLLGNAGAAFTDYFGLTLSPVASVEDSESFLACYFFLAFLCVYFLFYSR